MKFTAIYTKEERSETWHEVFVNAYGIAEAVAAAAGRIPEGHYLQAVLGNDTYHWERGKGFVFNPAWTEPSGDPDVKIMFRWKNMEQDLIDALIKEVATLVAAKIKEQMRRNDAD